MKTISDILKEFDEKFVNSSGDLDFEDEEHNRFLQKPTKIKSFITKVYEQTRQEALKEADRLIGQAHSDGFREGKQEMIKKNLVA